MGAVPKESPGVSPPGLALPLAFSNMKNIEVRQITYESMMRLWVKRCCIKLYTYNHIYIIYI